MDNKNSVVLFIHGRAGNAGESEHYRSLFPGCDVYGFDYRSQTPWDAEVEFPETVRELSEKYEKIILAAVSLGAYFSMISGIGSYIDRAYFISPAADMEKMILKMMLMAGVSENELEEKKLIMTDFGEELSWEYLQFVRNKRISWNVPTEILYGSNDELQSIDSVRALAESISAGLTVMEGGEHWFHTEEQMSFLDKWVIEKEQNK